MNKPELETFHLINTPIYGGKSAVDIAQELAQRGQTVASWKSWQQQQVEVALKSGELTPEEATSAVLKMNMAAGLIQLILDRRPSARIRARSRWLIPLSVAVLALLAMAGFPLLIAMVLALATFILGIAPIILEVLVIRWAGLG